MAEPVHPTAAEPGGDPAAGKAPTETRPVPPPVERSAALAAALAAAPPIDALRQAESPTLTPLQRAIEQALVAPPRELPRMQLARSLEEAGPRSFVFIDNHGRVRSPLRYRVMHAISYALLSSILIGGSVLYTYLLGPQGLLFGLVFGGLIGRNLWLTQKINQAALLSSHDRLDEAEGTLLRLLRRRWVGRRLRALIHHNLGAVSTRRGDHAEALRQLRLAVSHYQISWRRSPHLRSCQYGEVIALCNLGQLAEAKQKLQALPPAPEGDYLLLKQWTTELYVRFACTEAPPGSAELWTRAERALRITASSALLALCAWAYTQEAARDVDLAWHLLREAIDRLDGEPLQQIMPPLWRWMQDNRAAAEAAA